MRNTRILLVAGMLGALLVACAKPLPPERQGYVGVWRGGPMLLIVRAGGRVYYQRKEGGMSKSINAPLKEFHGDNFIVGLGFMSTEFAVSAPPHEESGSWHMTVDGVDVAKTDEDPDQLAQSLEST